MNKYLAIAALGSVNGCHMSHEPLFGLLKQGPHCPKSDAPKLNHVQANRLFLKNVYGGFIKGWYSENDHVVSDECFGHWIEPTFTNLHDLHKKAHEDFWSVSIDEVKGAGSMLIDTFYKNAEVCHFERVQDDFKGWCVANPGECIFGENMEERLFDNVFDILGSLFDLYKLSNVDDTCYSDLEQMSEINRLFNDMGELAASVSGFDYKWDQSIERTHIKKKAFHAQIKDAIKNYQYKNIDPLELMFPDLAVLLKGIEQSIEEFFEQLAESQKKMVELMKPRKINHHANKNTEHHQMLMDPFAMFKPHPVHHKMPETPKMDPLFGMMEMMKPHLNPQVPVSHWGNQF